MRQALLDVDGVTRAEVSLDEKRADVGYRAELVNPQKLVEAVDGAGFEASLLEPVTKDAEETSAEDAAARDSRPQ